MERACCSENSSESTKRLAREERESGVVESGPFLALVFLLVVVIAAGAGAAVVVVALVVAVVAEAE